MPPCAVPTPAGLELGTYCGYGARCASPRPRARGVVSVELSASNAEVAQRIWEHAGVADRVRCVVGTIGDSGATLNWLQNEYGCGEGAVDLLFIDHDKNAYLADLQSIVGRGLHRGSIVVADNVGIPVRQVPPLHARAAGPPVAHHRTPHPRGVPDSAAGPGAGVRVSRLGRLRRGFLRLKATVTAPKGMLATPTNPPAYGRIGPNLRQRAGRERNTIKLLPKTR